MDGATDDEFQEAEILWPDVTPPREDALQFPFAPSEPYEAVSVSRRAPAFGCRFEFSPSFLAGAQSCSSPESPDSGDEDEEWQEADVLWPDTVDEARRCGGGSPPWSFCGGFGQSGRRVRPSAPRREGWAPDMSSPIDIPGNVAARRLVGAAMARRL